MVTFSVSLDHQQSSALRKLLDNLNYEIVRNCVDSVEEARALLSVLEAMRSRLEKNGRAEPPARWTP